VPNFADSAKRMRLKPGLVLAIEPMINAGSAEVEMGPDGWTARTKDGKLSAHFEYSVAVTREGPRILGREGTYLAAQAITSDAVRGEMPERLAAVGG
jgi:methionyl aminopeptidase